jgi:hypothetical protein
MELIQSSFSPFSSVPSLRRELCYATINHRNVEKEIKGVVYELYDSKRADKSWLPIPSPAAIPVDLQGHLHSSEGQRHCFRTCLIMQFGPVQEAKEIRDTADQRALFVPILSLSTLLTRF